MSTSFSHVLKGQWSDNVIQFSLFRMLRGSVPARMEETKRSTVSRPSKEADKPVPNFPSKKVSFFIFGLGTLLDFVFIHETVQMC